jgi:hypothetical protein
MLRVQEEVELVEGDLVVIIDVNLGINLGPFTVADGIGVGLIGILVYGGFNRYISIDIVVSIDRLVYIW